MSLDFARHSPDIERADPGSTSDRDLVRPPSLPASLWLSSPFDLLRFVHPGGGHATPLMRRGPGWSSPESGRLANQRGQQVGRPRAGRWALSCQSCRADQQWSTTWRSHPDHEPDRVAELLVQPSHSLGDLVEIQQVGDRAAEVETPGMHQPHERT